MPSPQRTPEPPKPEAKHQAAHDEEDRLLTVASPVLGLFLTFSFAVGVLAGAVKDIPPVLGGIVLALIGGRIVGRKGGE